MNVVYLYLVLNIIIYKLTSNNKYTCLYLRLKLPYFFTFFQNPFFRDFEKADLKAHIYSNYCSFVVDLFSIKLNDITIIFSEIVYEINLVRDSTQ